MRKWMLITVWLLLTLLLISINNYFINLEYYSIKYSLFSVLIFHFCFVCISVYLLGVLKSKNSYAGLLTAFLLIFILVFLSFLEILIFKFSGVGFVDQTYLHFEPHTLAIAFALYPIEYSAVIFFISMICFVIIKLSPPIQTSLVKSLVAILLFSLLLIFHYGSSIGRFIHNYLEFKNQIHIQQLNAQAVLPYKKFGIKPVMLKNNEVKAEVTGNKKTNLIILYLESFSRFFVGSEKYPQLTPEIDLLINKFGEFENYQSTAKFTIQGLFSSQCGMIPEMNSGNNISESNLPYKDLPCLPSVLKSLDYHQEFIGGARKNFSNKELILKGKGFDEVWGWLDYKKPKDYQTNDWGLQDSDLIDFAIERAITLESEQSPFHLSILTLATHLNGNPDPKCPQYDKIEKPHKFIQGIHCTDFLVGKFVKELDASGVLENTTLLITADHGVFPVSLIKDLFGKKIDHNKLLGILINGYEFDTSLALALYDIPEILLASLDIKSNVTFINGLHPGEIDKDRFILMEKELFRDSKNKSECNLNRNIDLPVDACENERLMNIHWGYAASFNQISEINELKNVQMIAIKNNDEVMTELIINGQSVMNNFMEDGYPVTANERKYHDYFFVTTYDSKEDIILSYNAFKYNEQNIGRLEKMIKESNDKDNVYFVILESKHRPDLEKYWKKLLYSIDGSKFTDSEIPRLVVINQKNGSPFIYRWAEDSISLTSDELIN